MARFSFPDAYILITYLSVSKTIEEELMKIEEKPKFY